MRLTGTQYKLFVEALVDAYTEQRLTEMLEYRLEKQLSAIAQGSDFHALVFHLIRVANQEGWTDQLVAAARESNPGNPRLRAFAEQFGLAPSTPPPSEAQVDFGRWITRLGEIETQVCRVEVGRVAVGTGFLLGPDVLMTSQLVLADVVAGRWSPDDVVLRFDHKKSADGATVRSGTLYRLAPDWLIDQSPPSPHDADGEQGAGLPRPDELDYALIRVAGAPGYDQIGERPEPSAPARGWISPPAIAHEFVPGSPLYIVHHPLGDPLKLAMNSRAIIGVNANHTRVMYDVWTEPGSSGSPCFDAHLNLVALHQRWAFNNARPGFSVGIPAVSIQRLLGGRGLAGGARASRRENSRRRIRSSFG